MNKEKITVFDKIKDCISDDEILFDYSSNGKGIYKISKEMRTIILDSFDKLCPVSDKVYSNLFERRNYDRYKDHEELIDGPIRYTVYNNDGYPKGFIHRIESRGMSYSMEPNSTDIIVNGSFNYFYTKNSDDNRIIDTFGIMRYGIRYGNDGLVKEIKADFKATNQYRGDQKSLEDVGYRQFEFNSIDDLLQFKEALNSRSYAFGLLNNEYDFKSSYRR